MTAQKVMTAGAGGLLNLKGSQDTGQKTSVNSFQNVLNKNVKTKDSTDNNISVKGSKAWERAKTYKVSEPKQVPAKSLSPAGTDYNADALANTSDAYRLPDEAGAVYQTKDTKDTIPDEMLEKVNKLFNDVKKAICKLLDISEEELARQMEMLSIPMADILQPQSLMQLVLDNSGADDVMFLVTDENSAGTYKDLTGLVNSLVKEAGISQEEYQDIVSTSEFIKYAEAAVKEAVNSEAKNSNTDMKADKTSTDEFSKASFMNDINNTEFTEDETLNDAKAAQKSAIQAEGSQKASDMQDEDSAINELLSAAMLNTKDNALLNASKEIDKADSSKEADVSVAAAKDEFSFEVVRMDESGNTTNSSLSQRALPKADSNDKSSGNENAISQGQQFVEHMSNSLLTNETVDTERLLRAEQARDIANQIVEQLKVVIKPLQTSLEITLNPEQLGKVNLSIISREGAMTAQFTAQTNAAREAIESQMMVLRQNLEEQGIKVDAIEVTLAQYGFRQDGSPEGSHEESARGQQKRRGLIHADDLSFEDAVMSEAINEGILSGSGGNFDYTA